MHNSVQLVGLKRSDISVIKSASDVLHKHTCVDRKLLPFINKKFAQQINDSKISEEDVLIRQLIHKQPLFKQSWFDPHGNPLDGNIHKQMSERIMKVCIKAESLGDRVFETILR